MMYEILTGQPPFRGDKGLMAILLQQINEPIPSVRELRPDLPVEVDAVLQRATAKDPADRYQEANGLASDFRRAVLIRESQVVRPQARPSVQIDIDAPSTIRVDVPAERAPSAGEDVSDILIITKSTMPTTVIVVPPAEVVNPYKGLRPFEEADANDFFGRDALIERLLDRMREPIELNRFLAVIGPSGSGKSSVVKAGLVPKLRRGELRNSDSGTLSK
jgi:serine/threonine protein kinase